MSYIINPEYRKRIIAMWQDDTLPVALIDDARKALYDTEWWDADYADRAAAFLADSTCIMCRGEGWVTEVQVQPYGSTVAYEEFTVPCDCTMPEVRSE